MIGKDERRRKESKMRDWLHFFTTTVFYREE
jgi:hypothetical protein